MKLTDDKRRFNPDVEENAAPFYAKSGLSEGIRNKIPMTHWHDEPEWITILEGTMDFQVNETIFHLEKGDSIMILPEAIHRNLPMPKDTDFLRIVLNRRLLTQDSDVYRALIRPLLETKSTDYFYVPHTMEGASEVASLLVQLKKLGESEEKEAPLKIISFVHLLLYHMTKMFPPEKIFPEPASTDRLAQKDMVEYIRHHYSERITLQDIANAGNVSKSKCGTLFDKYMGSSPVDYVNNYRLGVSKGLLEYEDSSIADIALSCGFSSQSYFTELFSKRYKMTPREYRQYYRSRQ